MTELIANHAVFEVLEKGLSNIDRTTSSHWRQMTSQYHFDRKNKTFSGLVGFGAHAPISSSTSRLAHYILQTPYRRMGEMFPSFPVNDQMGRAIAQQQGFAYNLDRLRQVLSLSFVQTHLPSACVDDYVLVIGDGFGFLSSLILGANKNNRVIVVNLNKILLVDALSIRRAFPHKNIALVQDIADVEAATNDSSISVVLVQADDYELIKHFSISCAFNIASMQEMDPPVIRNYFRYMRASKGEHLYLYTCNRLEKVLPDGTAVHFFEYPWMPEDISMADELCPWHQKFYTKYPPFYKKYDGPIQHRLVKMKKLMYGEQTTS